MSDNGLLAPQATYGAVTTSYYATKEEVQQSLIEPTIQAPITLTSADGISSAEILKRGLVGGVPGVYTGSITLNPGSSSEGAAPAGLNIRSIDNGCSVEVGTDAADANYLYVAGPQGTSEVYNPKYNQVIKETPVFNFSFTLNSSAPGTAVHQIPFTVDISGAYMLQVDVNLYNADAIPNLPVSGLPAGALEWTVTSAGGETQYMSSTLIGSDFVKANQLAGVAEPMDYTVSNLGFLEADVPYQFNMYALNPVVAGTSPIWSLSDIQARMVQMC